MVDLELITSIIDIIFKIASVLVLFYNLLNWFVDYKLNQRLSRLKTKKNRCSQRKG